MSCHSTCCNPPALLANLSLSLLTLRLPKGRVDVNKWLHDMYTEAEQHPRDKWEKERVRKGG